MNRLLHHGLRCGELCGPRCSDPQSRYAVPHLRVPGKGSKVRYVPAHLLAVEHIHDYLQAAVLQAMAATNGLDRGANLGKVQKWLGHANALTTRLYDCRRSPPEDNPTFRVTY